MQAVKEQGEIDIRARDTSEKIALDIAEERVAAKKQEELRRQKLAAENASYPAAVAAEKEMNRRIRNITEQVTEAIRIEGQKQQSHLDAVLAARENFANVRAADDAARQTKIDELAKTAIESHKINTDELIKRTRQATSSAAAAKASSKVALDLSVDAHTKKVDAEVSKATSDAAASKAAELREIAAKSQQEYERAKTMADAAITDAKEAGEALKNATSLTNITHNELTASTAKISEDLMAVAAEGQESVQNALEEAMKVVETDYEQAKLKAESDCAGCRRQLSPSLPTL
jgi:hypothetical protein